MYKIDSIVFLYQLQQHNNTTIMTRTTEMNNLIEERINLCKYLYLIKKETDKRNNEKMKRWEKKLAYMGMFVLPRHIKILFGPFLDTPSTHKFQR